MNTIDLKSRRSAAALCEQAAYAAWYRGHYSVALQYGLRAVRHTITAMALARKERTR